MDINQRLSEAGLMLREATRPTAHMDLYSLTRVVKVLHEAIVDTRSQPAPVVAVESDRKFWERLPGRILDRINDMRFEIVLDRAAGFKECSKEDYLRALDSLRAFVLKESSEDAT